MYNYIAFTGSRNITPAQAASVARVARAAASFAPIAVGCALGTDTAVKNAATLARVFSVSSFPHLPYKAALVARSSALVHHTAAHTNPLVIGFPTTACPAGITPARSWRSGVTPSGTWSTLALAVGLGVPVLVYSGFLSVYSLPASFGSWRPVNSFGGQWFHALTPAATQPALF